MKTNLNRLMMVAVLLILAATSISAQTVEFSAKLQAYPLEYMQSGWGFGGETIGSSAWFYYSAFGEPGNDIIAVETPVVVLQAVGNGVNIQSIKLELVITKDFYLTSEIACEGVINL